MKAENKQDVRVERPPIVAVLGHVDHGKTTLLDFIRKSHVAEREHGGITQHIGAYQIIHTEKKKLHTITFIDTPGHEAFMKMRSRGATAADLAILVVAANDGVMPQTKESIRIIIEAGIPFIVALNKIDLPDANVDKVKQDLARNGVQVEGFGGDIPMIEISAKTGTGVDGLLSKIITVSQSLSLVLEKEAPFEGIVIETRVDKGKGMVASVIVKKGILEVGTILFEEHKQIARVRALFDDGGKGIKKAEPGQPVEILGCSMLPAVGAVLRSTISTSETLPVPSRKNDAPQSLPDFLSMMEEKKTLNIIIKTDTAGSMEAIVAALTEGVTIVATGVGDVSDADVLLAKSTGSFVIGFNTKWKTEVEKLAQTEGVVLRNYTIIYELLDELKEVIAGMQEVLTRERELGQGTIIAEFPYEHDRVAGTRITSGRLARGDMVKIIRGKEEVIRAKIKSLRQGKNDMTKAEEGKECGILFDKKVDFMIDDVIIAITKH